MVLLKIQEDNPAATLKRQVVAIAKLLKVNQKELLTLWLSNKIIAIVTRKEFATQVLDIAKQNINDYQYGRSKKIHSITKQLFRCIYRRR
jgi:hypothetical protein